MFNVRFFSRLVCALIFLIGATGFCLGDWNEGDGHKMHYPQLPDLTNLGMDVLAGPLSVEEGIPPYEKFIADDFRCSQSGPITSIHLWTSYNWDMILHELVGHPPFFSLVIYSDIPENESPTGYSMPGQVLWDTYMPPTAIREYARDLNESFYDPNPNEIIGQDSVCWQFNFEIPPEIAFEQEAGTIYWLGIHYSFDLNGDGIINLIDLSMFIQFYPGMFGWKTSGVEHFNDDAVFTDVLTWEAEPHVIPGLMLPANWREMRYPPTHPKAGQSIDLAFVINGEGGPEELDFGDCPDSYGTTLLNNGARHVIGGPWLGDAGDIPDPEPDGQPTPDALGDDNDVLYPPVNDDENGVSIPPLMLGRTDTITITVSGGGGKVTGWIDYDQNGIFDAGEQVVSNHFPDGIHPVLVTVPNTAEPERTYARFRIGTVTVIPSPTGLMNDGEVEDYEVFIEEAPPELDFGDAPEGSNAIAYPSTGVTGKFPTCIDVGPSGWIQHARCMAHFGINPGEFDYEFDGNAGLCPPVGASCFPPYDQDECFNDFDAGLHH